MQEYFSKKLSNMEEDLLRQESDFGSLITGPQDTDFLDFSGFESNSDQVYEQRQTDQDQLIYYCGCQYASDYYLLYMASFVWGSNGKSFNINQCTLC